MKFVLIFIAVALGAWLGFTPPPRRKKPRWWIAATLAVAAAAIVLTLLPPIAARPAYINYLIKNSANTEINVAGDIELSAESGEQSTVRKILLTNYPSPAKAEVIIPAMNPPTELLEAGPALIRVKIDAGKAYYLKTIDKDPWLTYAHVPGLGQMIRMMNLHVPLAWVGVMAYFIAMIYSIIYLRNKRIANDTAASSAAAIGTVFTLLATATGMIWAKENWGSYWNWDPRETSIFILLIIYMAYFSLRSAIRNDIARARLSSVYAVFAFAAVPFFVFVLPRLSSGLHPGSADEMGAGPIISGSGGMLDSNLAVSFALSLSGATLIFFWIFSAVLRRKLSKS
jgi:heme exporter protein C